MDKKSSLGSLSYVHLCKDGKSVNSGWIIVDAWSGQDTLEQAASSRSRTRGSASLRGRPHDPCLSLTCVLRESHNHIVTCWKNMVHPLLGHDLVQSLQPLEIEAKRNALPFWPPMLSILGAQGRRDVGQSAILLGSQMFKKQESSVLHYLFVCLEYLVAQPPNRFSYRG
jgi:hypothetical protein